MREVRMTFGEHLEELRLRILISLLYTAIGVTIAFINGDRLLQLALRPHERAFLGAQRNRQVDRMQEVLDDIEPLMTTPTEANFKGRPLVRVDDFRWEALFPAEVARERLRERLARPFAELEGRVSDLDSLTAADRSELGEGLRQAGEQLVEGVVSEMTSDLQLSSGAGLTERLRRIEQRLEGLEAEASAGTGRVKRAVGWGADLEPVLTDLQEFNAFLARRREEAVESTASLDQLRAWAQDVGIADGFRDAVDALERSVDLLARKEPKPIMVIDYTEHFSAYLKIAMIFGLFLSVPFILYELWKFVGAGLHPHEQRYVVTFMPFSLALFVGGVLFGYYVMIPVGLEFLASWGSTEVDMSFALGRYVGLFLTLTLILGLVFQTPLVMVFLFKLGIVDVSLYRRARRISVFLGVCLAVVLTPPDPFSWSLMALPMILLYELGILVCGVLARQAEAAET